MNNSKLRLFQVGWVSFPGCSPVVSAVAVAGRVKVMMVGGLSASDVTGHRS
jgi:hypothetical protein